ncbi:fluoride efflux transporter CrcB [Formicincola oecophyllae]|uniref:Fluoride-specific ion channel FluC n=1 Tax=Formicincola oecophyllae TaxID=2558361 RepID=A0A4Y6U9Y2_9PROT|nr:fluoride efflux transporter CrcB [Formicincola oecophyllae]QDH13181.1 fluoride efflux transporter CrcB [Formicincola oecophyllae]
MSFTTCLIVMAGGALGTLARFLVSVLTAPLDRHLPLGTIGINISGCFIIGMVGALAMANTGGSGRWALSDQARLFIMVGFCGGYTTFSSLTLQTLELFKHGALGRGLINLLGSVVLCMLAVALGDLCGQRLSAALQPQEAEATLQQAQWQAQQQRTTSPGPVLTGHHMPHPAHKAPLPQEGGKP